MPIEGNLIIKEEGAIQVILYISVQFCIIIIIIMKLYSLICQRASSRF